MGNYKQGDIVLLLYPYTNLSGTKKRPAVIISKKKDNYGNYIVSQITSKIKQDNYSFLLEINKITANLMVISEVRTNLIFTANGSIICKKVSSLKFDALKKLLDKIKKNIS